MLVFLQVLLLSLPLLLQPAAALLSAMLQYEKSFLSCTLPAILCKSVARLTVLGLMMYHDIEELNADNQ